VGNSEFKFQSHPPKKQKKKTKQNKTNNEKQKTDMLAG
jgi:hypothetical protein